MTFDEFFKTATGIAGGPYDYRHRLACGETQESESSVKREDAANEWGCATQLTPEQRALVDKLVADGLFIQHKFKPEPLYKTTGKGHYEADTVEEILEARTARKHSASIRDARDETRNRLS